MNWTERLDDTPRRREYLADVAALFSSNPASIEEKLADFGKYVPNNVLAKFLVRYELMQLIVGIPGNIVELGVGSGGGLMTFAQLSTILEPYNQHRTILGFDTFEGFPHFAEIDKKGTSQNIRVGGYAYESEADILRCAQVHDGFRPLSRGKQVELVRGDICETIPRYVEEHPELVVGLCYFDCDLYEPTKIGLQSLLPRMPKGAVVAFDELGLPEFPGETQALMDTVGVSTLNIRRFPMTKVSYVTLS